jgi:predicted TIM-barrel fold metal-dependent hydrolase
MKSQPSSKSAAVRSRLKHPVIDSDGHTLDFWPEFLDYLKQVAGPRVVERYVKLEGGTPISMRGWYNLSPQERRRHRATRAWWWVLPTKRTIDLATLMIPGLLYERLDEMGIDFTVIYNGLITPHIEDEELRRAACFALNKYHADLFKGYTDRITPISEIPMHTPDEAIAELEHAVKELGMKAVMMASFVQRPIPAAPEKFPQAYWFDAYGLDSDYDYDPVWAKCMELKVAPTFHSTSIGLGMRASISNFVYNNIGNLAASGEIVCKSLFMGGVTRRFPKLKFAFQEGGVGWACILYADLMGHWLKRNRRAMENYNPANLDRKLFTDLFGRYRRLGRDAGRFVKPKLEEFLMGLQAGGSAEGRLEDPT